MYFKDITGQSFGFLTVLQPAPSRKNGHAWWKCECKCGNVIELSSKYIVRGTGSCGCLVHRRGKDHPYWRGCGELMSSFFSMIKKGASTRDHTFEITIQDAWELFEKQKGICALSGLTIELPKSRYELDSYKTASLDRIDNSVGYTKNNIQWVHKHINMMKRTLSQEQFIELCKAVASHADKAS